jgi:Protein of unknown function (DUF2793)
MNDTPNLLLPYLIAAQAQKHVTHNEALRALDCLVQLAVLDRDLTAPPTLPVDGGRYIVAAAATADWAGQTSKIAAFQDGAWAFFAPREGWLVWIADEDKLVVWDGLAWISAVAGAVNPVALVGVNATADAANRLAVASANSLFNHDGTDHRIKINKAAAANTASVLFQRGFSGRAECGLTGDDNFHLKVSPDSTTWRDALVLVAATGTPRLPSATVATLPSAANAGGGAVIYVPDEAGGSVIAFSDGTGWRRVTDRALVS